jgi:hypothetical protein
VEYFSTVGEDKPKTYTGFGNLTYERRCVVSQGIVFENVIKFSIVSFSNTEDDKGDPL